MNRTHCRARRAFLAALLGAVGGTILMMLILVLRLPDQCQGLKPGDHLPSVRLISPEGKPVDTSSWHGQPTLLMLFDPLCPACRSELDNIDALAPAMPNLRIALLSTRPHERRETQVATYLDPTGVLTGRMRRFAVPALYWIGPDGRIEYARSGARSLPEEAVIFSQLLAGKNARAVDATQGSANGTPNSRH